MVTQASLPGILPLNGRPFARAMTPAMVRAFSLPSCPHHPSQGSDVLVVKSWEVFQTSKRFTLCLVIAQPLIQ
eukprot:m.444368 g.444368  ORF g.444368 m.444368 type:complete len:73 (+) comp20296_c11_seq18:1522-1740(+)